VTSVAWHIDTGVYRLAIRLEHRGGAVDTNFHRDVMGHYPTGVVLVSGMCDGEPVGMVVGTFSSVSLDPPLVSFMPQKTSRSYTRLLEAPVLCISVFAHDQTDVCRVLAGSDPDKFDKVAWSLSPEGAPVLHDAVAQIHCTRAAQFDAGDHWITLCSIIAMEVSRPVTPLLFFQGGYGGFTPRIMSARGDAELFAALRLADVASPHLEELATRLQCQGAALVAVDDDTLTVAVSAYGGTAQMTERLGQRIPLIPPIGTAYVAAAAEHVRDRWLAKIPDRDQVPSYRQRLDDVLSRGVEITLSGPDAAEVERLRDAMADYAAGRLTPARQRAVSADLGRAPFFPQEVRLDDDEIVDVSFITAPVHNPEGDVSMLAQIGQLPRSATGATVKGWIQQLEATVAKIEQELVDGTGRSRLEEYRKWLGPVDHADADSSEGDDRRS
jgi:flavin reductase (DIM6/NTAB) family NADH-FMN oxidoreductase RutF